MTAGTFQHSGLSITWNQEPRTLRFGDEYLELEPGSFHLRIEDESGRLAIYGGKEAASLLEWLRDRVDAAAIERAARELVAERWRACEHGSWTGGPPNGMMQRVCLNCGRREYADIVAPDGWSLDPRQQRMSHDDSSACPTTTSRRYLRDCQPSGRFPPNVATVPER